MAVYHITLTRGYEAVVSEEDSDLAIFNWCIHRMRDTSTYAKRWNKGTHRAIFLHRVILERVLGRPLFAGEYVDHRNGDGLDNTRGNLRLATRPQNAHNRRANANNTSGYKGVYLDTRSGRWRAVIGINGEHVSLGTYGTPEEAHSAYEAAAEQYFGEFRRT